MGSTQTTRVRMAITTLAGPGKGARRPRRDTMDIIRIIIAILLPPLGVFLQEGLGKHFWINIILTLLGYIPGIVHAIYIIIKR